MSRPLPPARATGGVALPRPLAHEVALEGPADRLLETFRSDPRTWLPAPARPAGPGAWTVDLAAGPLHRAVVVRVGRPWVLGASVWRTVTWDPQADEGDIGPLDRLLPTFEGEIGVVAGDYRVLLRLRGGYRPPGGLLGAAVDAAVLHRGAADTASRFCADVAARLKTAE